MVAAPGDRGPCCGGWTPAKPEPGDMGQRTTARSAEPTATAFPPTLVRKYTSPKKYSLLKTESSGPTFAIETLRGGGCCPCTTHTVLRARSVAAAVLSLI